jgi:hypothetical protein
MVYITTVSVPHTAEGCNCGLTSGTLHYSPVGTEKCHGYTHDNVFPEDGILHSRRRENIKSYIALTGWTV